jgi:esterase/lipase superfamily enzyme
LKKTLRMIGQTPGVEGIHLLAHSRGAGLTTYASPKDRALLLARILFRSDRRVGRSQAEDISAEMQAFFAT